MSFSFLDENNKVFASEPVVMTNEDRFSFREKGIHDNPSH